MGQRFEKEVLAAIISCGILVFAFTAVAYYDTLYAYSLGANSFGISLINSVGLLSAAISGVFIGLVAEQ
ncbi:MAG: hypothetical protein ACUVQ0_00605 [Thermoproteota archaeon]